MTNLNGETLQIRWLRKLRDGFKSWLLLPRWGYDKFPEEKPLVFCNGGRPINPPLNTVDGLKAVLESTLSYIQKEVPVDTLKFWRSQSPRHFHGGEWNQNGSRLSDDTLEGHRVWTPYTRTESNNIITIDGADITAWHVNLLWFFIF